MVLNLFLKQSIEEEVFYTPETFNKFMLDVRKEVNDTYFLAKNMPRYKDFVFKGATFQEQEANAEMVYCNCKLVNDMIIDFLAIFIHPANRNFMSSFMEYASDQVVETVFHYCKSYSNLLLDDYFTN